MQDKKILIIFILCNVFIAAMSFAAINPEPNKEDFKKGHLQKHWWESRKPCKSNPDEQLIYTNQLKDSGHLRKASSQYRALVYTWPQSSEAPVAQFNYAGCMYKRNKLINAFDEYQFLLDTYPGFSPYEEVVERQYAIADAIATRKRHFLFFPYRTPEKAISLFQQLIRNAPQMSKVSKLQFRMGRIYEKTKQYDMAIDAYKTYLRLYPKGPLAEQACFSRAVCYCRLTRKNPVSADMRESAKAAFQYFLARYPTSSMTDPARTYLKELRMTQTTDYYKQARAYERSAEHTYWKKLAQKRLIAAKLIYQRLINEFPVSKWSDTARSRISHINTKLEKYSE